MFSPPESGGMTHLLDKNTPGVQSGAKKKSCTISSVKKKLYDRNHDFNRVHNVSCMQNLGGGGGGGEKKCIMVSVKIASYLLWWRHNLVPSDFSLENGRKQKMEKHWE